jgi:ribose 5-phosphate isomerase RpiB
MNFTPEQVDLIVQRVLEHLVSPAAARVANDTAPAVGDRSSAGSKGVRIDEPVITQALLAESVNGSATVSIGAKAILTPSARDFVRARGIEIIREKLQSTARSARCQVIVARWLPQAESVLDGLRQEGIVCDRKLSGTPAEVAALATSSLCRGEAELVVVLTDQPELTVCLANRNERIRAAAVGDSSSVERVVKSMQANLLAVDPSGGNILELKSTLKTFVTQSWLNRQVRSLPATEF